MDSPKCFDCGCVYWMINQMQGGGNGMDILRISMIRCAKCDMKYIWSQETGDYTKAAYFDWSKV